MESVDPEGYDHVELCLPLVYNLTGGKEKFPTIAKIWGCIYASFIKRFTNAKQTFHMRAIRQASSNQLIE